MHRLGWCNNTVNGDYIDSAITLTQDSLCSAQRHNTLLFRPLQCLQAAWQLFAAVSTAHNALLNLVTMATL